MYEIFEAVPTFRKQHPFLCIFSSQMQVNIYETTNWLLQMLANMSKSVTLLASILGQGGGYANYPARMRKG